MSLFLIIDLPEGKKKWMTPADLSPDVSCSWELFTYPAAWGIRPPRPGWCAHAAARGRMLPWRGCSGRHRSPRPATRTLRQTEPAPPPAGASLLACPHSERSSVQAPGQLSPAETGRCTGKMGWLSLSLSLRGVKGGEGRKKAVTS